MIAKLKNKLPDIFIVIAAAGILALEIFRPVFTDDETYNGIILTLISRSIGCLVFIPLAVRCGYNVFGFAPQGRFKAVFSTIPALLVVVNNFPFIGLVSGNIDVVRHGMKMFMFVLQSLSIGLFEEFAFRGVLFPMILEKRRDTRKKIFFSTVVSSALFGTVHLFNLLEGAGAGGVILQVGYSFLIGGMCSVVLLKTGNIFICVLLHAIFDFGGFFVPTVAQGALWDTPTVIITAVLGVFTLIHTTAVLLKTDPSEIDYIFTE